MEENKKIIRCAIYTRKSSEEGLDLEFNSLQAQREACEAYINSQKHEGWRVIEKLYDDGGFSGGTLTRPALQELLKDCANGLVDIIVVYKIGRLTRSLMDFSKIVDVLNQKNTSFVSITQQFNTSTSMGRLTLNMLLSFAQFEREVTGERIRDKYAASKKKGMWMGGNPPMGYIRREKKIYPSEYAERVRQIFNKYIELKSIANVKYWLELNHLGSQNNRPLSAGNITLILKNRAYLGEVGHKGVWYKGEHQAIIDAETFAKAQEIMMDNSIVRKEYKPYKSLLSGKIFDDMGNYMSPSWSTGGNGKKYRYYISQAVIRHDNAKTGKITKISLAEVERFTDNWFTEFLRDKKEIIKHIAEFILDKQKNILDKLSKYSIDRQTERLLIKKVQVKEAEIIITLYKEQFDEFLLALYEDRTMKIIAPETLKEEISFTNAYRIGTTHRSARIIIGSAYNKTANKDKIMIAQILKSHKWTKELLDGKITIKGLIAREGVCERYIYRILNLALLPPLLTTAILEGRQPPDLTLQKLLSIKTHNWKEQEKLLGF